MEQLLEDYKRKLKTVQEMLNADTITAEQIQRLNIKQGMIRSFIVDIERAMADTTNESSGLHLQRVSNAGCDCELPSPVDPHDNFEKHICSKCSGFITQTYC